MDGPEQAPDNLRTPPAGSLICEWHARGLLVTDQPRHRLGREAGGVVSFGLCMLLLMISGILRLVEAVRWGDWAIMAAIVLVMPATTFGVIWLLMDRINKGRLPTVLWTENQDLVLLQPGARGMRRREWPLASIGQVQVVTRGVSANLKPLGALRISFDQGKPLDLFDLHPISELEWVAGALRLAMNREPRG